MNRYWMIPTAVLGILSSVLSPCRAGEPPSDDRWRTMGFRPVPRAAEVPNIRFTDESGAQRSLSDFRGSVVLLNFWASWCPPCRAEMPSMGKLARALEGTDFVMLPVNVGENNRTVKRFVETFSIGFPVYLDKTAAGAADIGVGTLPTSLIINREGQVVAVVNGSLEWDDAAIITALGAWARRGEG